MSHLGSGSGFWVLGTCRCEVDLLGYCVYIGFGMALYAVLAYTCVISPGFEEMSKGKLGHNKSVRHPELKVGTPAHAKHLGWYLESEFRVAQAFLRVTVLAGVLIVVGLLAVSSPLQPDCLAPNPRSVHRPCSVTQTLVACVQVSTTLGMIAGGTMVRGSRPAALLSMHSAMPRTHGSPHCSSIHSAISRKNPRATCCRRS